MRAPDLTVGDGALGFWSALREVFPETRCQRDWVHKTLNLLASLPKSVHSRAKVAIKEVTGAEDKEHAQKAIEGFADEFSAKWPKAVSKIVSDKEALLAFYDYPAEHRRHLRTSNPIESVFALVRARTEITKRPGSRQAGLANYASAFESRIYPGRSVPEVAGLVGMRPHANYIMLPLEPGCEIDSNVSSHDGTGSEDGWSVISGTSASAPQLAGVCALLKHKNPGLSPADIKAVLKRTARDVTEGQANEVSNPVKTNGRVEHVPVEAGLGPDGATGHGLVDAFAAWKQV